MLVSKYGGQVVTSEAAEKTPTKTVAVASITTNNIIAVESVPKTGYSCVLILLNKRILYAFLL